MAGGPLRLSPEIALVRKPLFEELPETAGGVAYCDGQGTIEWNSYRSIIGS